MEHVRRLKRVVLVTVLLLMMASPAHAQSGGGYDLTWSTVDSGGGMSINAGYTLHGSIGQPDAGVALGGGGYTLVGGFWGGAAAQYRIYLPVILRN
jgi:hypothetical protein